MSATDNRSAVARIIGITVDCTDPVSVAEFYRGLMGWAVTHATDDLVVLGDGPIRLGFQRVPEHRRPEWPGADKQLHLDFSVEHSDEAEQLALSLGATRPRFQPGGDSFVVLQDPAGHPFCLSTFGG